MAEEKGKGTTTTVDPEELEKSWDESIVKLKELLKSDETPPETEEEEGEDEKGERKPKLQKSDEKPPEEDEDEEEDEEEEEAMSKSLEELVAEEDSEAEIVMDVEPFLKSLVKGQQKYFDRRFAKLAKSIGKVEALSKAQAEAAVKGHELQKAIDDKVQKIGETSVTSSSVLRKGGERFPKKGGNGAADYDPRKILRKSFVLLQQKKIDPLMATKIEGRVNRRMPLPEEVAGLFEEE